MLKVTDPHIIQVVLDGISHILAASGDVLDQVITFIDECGGFEVIEALQDHNHVEIYRLAYSIMDRYYVRGVSVHLENFDFHA